MDRRNSSRRIGPDALVTARSLRGQLVPERVVGPAQENTGRSPRLNNVVRDLEEDLLTAAVMCSLVSLLTLGWWAPASNQVWRTRIAGREIPKGENELTLGELGTRIVEIRAFGPAAPARRLSVMYHTRWALSVTPLVLAVFALMVAGHSGRTAVGSAFATVVSLGGFALLLTWTSYLAFRGSVPPWLGAWLPNITFLGVIATLTLCSHRRRDGVTRRAVRSSD